MIPELRFRSGLRLSGLNALTPNIYNDFSFGCLSGREQFRKIDNQIFVKCPGFKILLCAAIFLIYVNAISLFCYPFSLEYFLVLLSKY